MEQDIPTTTLNAEALYRLSTDLNRLIADIPKALQLHHARYMHFVKGSERGHNCTYAALTRRHAVDEFSEAEEFLLQVKQSADSLLDQLRALHER